VSDLLFLDIDGVLNDHTKLPSGYCGINPAMAVRLNTILDALPGLRIVVSSAWRYIMLRGEMTLQGFEYLLLIHGVKCRGRIIGHTLPDGPIEDEPNHHDPEVWRRAGLLWRAQQIRAFVDQAKPARWCVLDDLPIGVENLVQTNGDVGLTDGDVARVIRYFEGTNNVN
jgi:hypothetical protein